MAGFAARYPGTCARCGNQFKISDPIAYDDDDNLYGVECCGDASSESNGAGFDAFNRGRAPGIAVLPPGGKRPACTRCFIIHTPAQGDQCE